MSIEDRFDLFHSDNPHVYTRLVALARQAKARGRTKLGIELLFAVLRWESIIATRDQTSPFKLNDHYTSRYARLIMGNESDLSGFFETRALRS